MDWNGLDHYALLDVDRGASGEEIGRAYRRAARATHPDVHPDEPAAGARFTAITIAYQTLSDPARRASYDRARPTAPHANRVDPVSPRGGTPSVVPIRAEQARRPHPVPMPTPTFRVTPVETREQDALELTASLSRLLHWTWRAF